MYTWVESQLPWLRGNVKRNRFAQHWHQVFLDATDPETSWGAWQVMMRCGDERFFLWGSLGTIPEDATVARRIRFVTAREDQIEQKLGREAQRKETLFGMKIERGEIFPFFPR